MKDRYLPDLIRKPEQEAGNTYRPLALVTGSWGGREVGYWIGCSGGYCMSVYRPAVKAVPDALLSLSTLLALSLSLLLTACGGGGGGSTTPVTPTITSVAVVCSPSSINTNQTSTCTPTVSGTGNYSSSVTWSVISATASWIACSGTPWAISLRLNSSTVLSLAR